MTAGKWIRRWVGSFLLLSLVIVGSASAFVGSLALPTYHGAMDFSPIHEVAGPEEFTWEVSLGEGQELRAIDDHHALVLHSVSGHAVYAVIATAAHDSIGSDVPTSLEVSDGNVITLTVHHRAGNPVTGSPFDYPIIAGEGWEGGFQTTVIQGPPPEPVHGAEMAPSGADYCVVPMLKGRTLKGAKGQLREAGCRIGDVTKRKGATARTGRVVRQSSKPGATVAPGTMVGVTLGLRP